VLPFVNGCLGTVPFEFHAAQYTENSCTRSCRLRDSGSATVLSR
jgi:hypothetical protein